MFCDVHLHLVPGVDDGPKHLEDSLLMARALVDRGWSRAAVTPHIRPGMFPNDAAPLRAAIEALSRALADHDVPLEVGVGAEHYLTPEVVEAILAGEGLPLWDGATVLLEAPASGPVPGLDEVVFRMGLAGRQVLFAHPERCEVFHTKGLARHLTEAGARLQLDLGSLAGAYGRTARKHARRLLDDGLYAVAGTDLHNPTQAERDLDDWLSALRKRVGESGLKTLLAEGPDQLVSRGAGTR